MEILKDPMVYKDTMLRSDVVHWRKVCVEELKKSVRQRLFSTVPRLVRRKMIGYK